MMLQMICLGLALFGMQEATVSGYDPCYDINQTLTKLSTLLQMLTGRTSTVICGLCVDLLPTNVSTQENVILELNKYSRVLQILGLSMIRYIGSDTTLQFSPYLMSQFQNYTKALNDTIDYLQQVIQNSNQDIGLDIPYVGTAIVGISLLNSTNDIYSQTNEIGIRLYALLNHWRPMFCTQVVSNNRH